MSDVYVICAKRTPFGSFGGVLSQVTAPELAAQTIRHILDATALAAEAIDEVIIGQVLRGGRSPGPDTSGYAPGRHPGQYGSHEN